MAYGKSNQTMDLKWQMARKVDRLDLGSFAATEFFYRTAIIFGLVRAVDPKENRNYDDQPLQNDEKSIDDLILSVDGRIKELLETDTTALLMGKVHLKEAQDFQIKTISAYYDMVEIMSRCKLIDTVRAQGEEI